MTTSITPTAAPTDGTAGLPPHGKIGLPTASALYIAAVLGTGILVLPGLAADAAGPGSILGVAAVLLLSIPLAGTFAALAARYPDAGGVATFVRLALGVTAARATGYLFLFGVAFGAPIVAVLGGSYVVAAIGADAALVPLLGVGLMVITYGLGLFGLRISGKVQLGLSALLVGVVVLVVVTAAPAADAARLEPFLPNGWGGVGLTISLFIWAFAGWEAVTHIAAEFRNPRRTIPLATAIAVTVVGIAYLALQVITVLVPINVRSTVPLIDLVSVTLPGIGPGVVAVIAVIIVVGVMNAYVPAFANLAASLGRDGHLPRWIARGAEPGAVPRRAVIVTGLQALIYSAIFFAFQLDFNVFILINTSSMVAVYALGMIAAVRLLERFTVGWWMAAISVVLSVGLLVLAGPYLLIAAGIALVAVAVTVVRLWRSRRAVTTESSQIS